MTSALVGYSGFVGGNLRKQRHFDLLVNSSNTEALAGGDYDIVVFSAAKAEKWRINLHPEADLAHISELKRLLDSFRTQKLVLMSTVDVYKTPIGVDESTPVPEPGLHPYGLHRRDLEEYAQGTFDDVTVVRLPGLFGPGIKKNVIFDLLTDNNVEKIHHEGRFQYYDLRDLWAHLELAIAARLPLVNFATEPVTTRDVARAAFDLDFTNEPEGVSSGTYDMRTIHDAVFGGTGGYLYNREVVLEKLANFVQGERAKA